MGNDIFSKGKNAIYAVGIFCFIISIPLYILILKIGFGTLLCLPSLTSELAQNDAVGAAGIVMVIGLVISVAITLAVWFGVSKKAGIITAIVLGIVFWRSVLVVILMIGFLVLCYIVLLSPLFIVCTLYHAVKMFIEYLNSNKSADPLASCNRKKRW